MGVEKSTTLRATSVVCDAGADKLLQEEMDSRRSGLRAYYVREDVEAPSRKQGTGLGVTAITPQATSVSAT